MIYFKTNNTEYQANIAGKVADRDWGNRESKAVTLTIEYTAASQLFVDGLSWSIVQRDIVPVYDKDGKPTVTKDFMLEKGKNTYNLELTGEQIKQVMEAYPFCPRVYVELPSEDVVLEREGGIDLSLGVTAVTDINYIYDLKGGK